MILIQLILILVDSFILPLTSDREGYVSYMSKLINFSFMFSFSFFILSTHPVKSLIKLLLDAAEPILYTGRFCVLITRRIFKGSLCASKNGLADTVSVVCSFKSLNNFSQISTSFLSSFIFLLTFFLTILILPFFISV